MVVIAALQAAVRAPAPDRLPLSGGGGFVVPDQMVATPVRPGSASTVPVGSINGAMLLALQQQTGREHADQEGRRHGQQVLDELRRLQCALLSSGGAANLADLESLARTDPGDVDPALAGVLASIRLRARVELERRSRPDPV